jgi:hypothetical protein
VVGKTAGLFLQLFFNECHNKAIKFPFSPKRWSNFADHFDAERIYDIFCFRKAAELQQERNRRYVHHEKEKG